MNSNGKASNLEMIALPLSLAIDQLTGLELEKAPNRKDNGTSEGNKIPPFSKTPLLPA